MILHWKETSQLHKRVEALPSKIYHTHVLIKRPQFMPGRPHVCRFVVQKGPTDYYTATSLLSSN